MKKLTPQETEVMWGIAEGLTNEQIAVRMKISKHTVKFHVFNALEKLDSHCRAHAAVLFVLARPDEARRRFELPPTDSSSTSHSSRDAASNADVISLGA